MSSETLNPKPYASGRSGSDLHAPPNSNNSGTLRRMAGLKGMEFRMKGSLLRGCMGISRR